MEVEFDSDTVSVENQTNITDERTELPQNEDENMTGISTTHESNSCNKQSSETKLNGGKYLDSTNNIRDKMLDHLANKTNIHFKSQQLGEPDLSYSEKRSIAENVLNQSHSTFLSRFGDHLLMEHLPFFANPSDDESYEVRYYVNKLKSCQCKPISNVQIKNRRFEAMKRLMSEGEYFSVGEMRKRNPLLFDQLLGNFLADPQFKTTDDQEHAIAHLLLEQIEQDQVAELKKHQMETELQQINEYQDSSDEEDIPKDIHEFSTSKEMKSNLALWGKSYKNNHTIGKTRWKNKHSKLKNPKSKCTLSQQEKLLLINEFTSSMFNSFLQGKDEFNYSEVDNNPEYDDVNQCDVDEEEKYFDSESPEEKNPNDKNEEDDELDAFMKNVESEITSENLANSFQLMNAVNDEKP